MYYSAQQIINAMAAIVEAPGYPLLKSYRDDFYKHDQELIHKSWSKEAKAIWVVTPNGTHLNFFGHHSRQVESVTASVYSGYSNTEVYLLTSNVIKRIAKEEAIRLASILDFEVKGHTIFSKKGIAVATIEIKPDMWARPRNNAKVHFNPLPGYSETKELIDALKAIALGEVINYFQSLFCSVETISVGQKVITDHGLVNLSIEESDDFSYIIFNEAEYINSGKGFYDGDSYVSSQKKAKKYGKESYMQLANGDRLMSVTDAKRKIATVNTEIDTHGQLKFAVTM